MRRTGDRRQALQPPTKKCIDKLGSYARTAGVGTTRLPKLSPQILAFREHTRISREGSVPQVCLRSLGDGNASASDASSMEHQPCGHEAEDATQKGTITLSTQRSLIHIVTRTMLSYM